MIVRHWLLPVAVSAIAICAPSFLSADVIVAAGSGNVALGQTIDIPVSISGVSDLYAYQFDLSFDPNILQLQSVNEGPFLPSAGSTFYISGTIDNTGGSATLTADTLIGPIPGASGAGNLAIFDFQAIGAGTSPITLSNVSLVDSALNDIPSISTNGAVVVSTSAVPEPATFPIILLACGALFATRKFIARAS